MIRNMSPPSSTPASLRIGKRSIASTTESTILRSLADIRRNTTTHHSNNSCHRDDELVFWNCSEFSPMVLHSLRKLLVRDGRRFAAVKFYFASPATSSATSSLSPPRGTRSRCPSQRQQRQDEYGNDNNDDNNSACACAFGEVLTIILESNCTTELVIKGRNDVASQAALTAAFGHGRALALADNTSLTSSLRLVDQHHLSTAATVAVVAGLAASLAKNATLQSLTLSGCRLDDASLAKVVRSCGKNGTLQRLDLSRNHAANETLEAIADALSSPKTCSLASLDVSHQSHRPPQQGLGGGDTEEPEQVHDHHQQQQDQQHELEATATVVAFCRAFEALAANNTVTKLDISGNPLLFAEPSLLDALCQCLVANQSLEYVDVSIDDGGIPSSALIYLAQHCLPHTRGGSSSSSSRNNKLTTLVLFGGDGQATATTTTPLLDEAAAVDAIINGLQSNTTLRCMAAADGTVVDVDARIQHHLDMNSAGKGALLSRGGRDNAAPLPLGVWPTVSARTAAAVTGVTTAAGECGGAEDDDDDDCDPDDGAAGSSTRVASVLFSLLREGPALLTRDGRLPISSDGVVAHNTVVDTAAAAAAGDNTMIVPFQPPHKSSFRTSSRPNVATHVLFMAAALSATLLGLVDGLRADKFYVSRKPGLRHGRPSSHHMGGSVLFDRSWSASSSQSIISTKASAITDASPASPDEVLSALEALYPTSGLDQRIALSRKDGYWPYIQKGEDPPQEFVYGEFDIGFFALVLERAAAYYSKEAAKNDTGSAVWKDKVFCDLGSGTGRLVLAAAALYPWKLCRGIELLDGIHHQATEILKQCCPPADEGQQSTATSFATACAALSPSAATSIPLSPLELKCGSFDDPYEFFGDADLIFVFSSCMSPPILMNLARSIGRQCQPGCLVLTTEYTLPNGNGGSYIEPLEDDPGYPSGVYALELLESITGPNLATGGESTVHIHRVTQSVGTGVPRTRPPLSVSEMAYRAVKHAEDPSANSVDDFLQRLVNQMAFIGLPESWWNKRRDVPLTKDTYGGITRTRWSLRAGNYQK